MFLLTILITAAFSRAASLSQFSILEDCAGCEPSNLIQECSIDCTSKVCELLPSTGSFDCACAPRYKFLRVDEEASIPVEQEKVVEEESEIFVKRLAFDEDGLKNIFPKDWDARSISGAKQVKIKGDTLVVTFPKYSYKSPSRGGFQFDAKPLEKESDTMTIAYDIDVPKGFKWVKGGNLPGLYAGESLLTKMQGYLEPVLDLCGEQMERWKFISTDLSKVMTPSAHSVTPTAILV
jgi:hypothetical protein